MDLDILLRHHFGTSAIETLDADALAAGCDRALLALGLETDPGRRFALWALLHALDAAPDPAAVFKDAGVRRAAEDYVRAAARMARVQPSPAG